MKAAFLATLHRHPLLRDALLWAIPALVFGAVLRALILSYIPYAYWGSDSRSYYDLAHRLVSEGRFDFSDKRRYLYPLLMVPVALLPGAPLKWLAWIQHLGALATLLPVAYIIRKVFVHWRLWIVPVTVLYTGMPVLLWYEHELLGECLFFGLLICSVAGWVAWSGERRLERARALWWWFFVPFVLFILTKPSGRFFWPGIIAGLALTAAWRRLGWQRLAGMAALLAVTPFVGSRRQGAWLLYVASFPLTRLETPAHADYKAQIRDLVEPLQKRLDVYYLLDGGLMKPLRDPARLEGRPLWTALQTDERRKSKLYADLALEGIRARPGMFVYFGFQRLVASANPSQFKEYRFAATTYPQRFLHIYEAENAEVSRGGSSPAAHALGLPDRQPLPPYEELAQRLAPAPDSAAARLVMAWVRGFQRWSDLVRLPPSDLPIEERQPIKARPTLLGWWLFAAMVLALLMPRFRGTMGVWTLAAAGYLFGVFLISEASPRYFAPAWPVLIPLLAVPADALVDLVCRCLRRRASPSSLPAGTSGQDASR